MFKEFFLRRRAYKVGQNIRHMHDNADTVIASGSRLLAMAQQQWESYCRSSISEVGYDPHGENKQKLERLKNDDLLRAVYLKGFTQGYLDEDAPPSFWPASRVKE